MKLLSFLFGKAEDGKKLIKYNISQKIKTSQWIPVEAKSFCVNSRAAKSQTFLQAD